VYEKAFLILTFSIVH